MACDCCRDGSERTSALRCRARPSAFATAAPSRASASRRLTFSAATGVASSRSPMSGGPPGSRSIRRRCGSISWATMAFRPRPRTVSPSRAARSTQVSIDLDTRDVSWAIDVPCFYRVKGVVEVLARVLVPEMADGAQ